MLNSSKLEGWAGNTWLAMRAAATLLLAWTLDLLSGCALVRAPKQVFSEMMPSGKSTQLDPIGLQLQVLIVVLLGGSVLTHKLKRSGSPPPAPQD